MTQGSLIDFSPGAPPARRPIVKGYQWSLRRRNKVASPLKLLHARIRALEVENRRLRKLAITDDLTHAFNRRHFQDAFRSLLRVPARSHSIALCLFDIDNFKAYNDIYGHLQGDEALRAVTAAIRGTLRRASDRLFRLGGDEFGVLFWEPSPDRALGMVQRMRSAVNALQLPHTGNARKIVTATFGLAWCDSSVPGALSPQKMYATADSVLYDAKRSGRDRVAMQVMA